MLPDSMNVGVIAENIKKLEVMVQEAGSELPTPEAGDTGKILKVGSDGYELAAEYSYTPPAYSTEEVNTGQKWADGKDIYCIVKTGLTPDSETNYIDIPLLFDSLINIIGRVITDQGIVADFIDTVGPYGVPGKNAIRLLKTASTHAQNANYYCAIYYTKPDPTPDVVPAPDNYTRSVDEPIEEVTEEPVQETKSTRKRSTSSK